MSLKKYIFLLLGVIHFQIASYNVTIFFHLYDLPLMQECVQKINHFININSQHNVHIIINIPIDKNLDKLIAKPQQLPDEVLLSLQQKSYYPALITQKNAYKLTQLEKHLKTSVQLKQEHIHLLFSENRGLDIGGFFLMLDYAIEHNITHDYFVKIHTKTNRWRRLNLKILDINLSMFLGKYDVIYGCPHYFDFNHSERQSSIGKYWHEKNCLQLQQLLEQYQLPQKSFFFAGGTMFIASSKVTDFFRDHNRLEIFNSLNPGYPAIDGCIEHAYERFFGYLFEHLNFNVLHLQKYPYRAFND